MGKDQYFGGMNCSLSGAKNLQAKHFYHIGVKNCMYATIVFKQKLSNTIVKLLPEEAKPVYKNTSVELAYLTS